MNKIEKLIEKIWKIQNGVLRWLAIFFSILLSIFIFIVLSVVVMRIGYQFQPLFGPAVAELIFIVAVTTTVIII